MQIRAIAIDDDPVSLILVEKLCKRINDLTLVNTYSDAIKGAAGIVLDKPDLIFLDMDMPEFNGLEIMESLVHSPKIIVISANSQFKERAMKLEAVAFIEKPARLADFEASVEKARQIIRKERPVYK